MANLESNYKNLTPYLPRTILNWYQSSPPGEIHSITRHEGAIVCIDASGFTALTKQLSSLGKEGPEILTRVLNLFFEETSRVIFGYGGDVLKFAGDALWAYFPRCPEMEQFFRDILEAVGRVNFSDELKGRTALSVHVGAETGEFYLASLGDPGVRLEAEPVGNLLGIVYRACDAAQDNECALGPALAHADGEEELPQGKKREFHLIAPAESSSLSTNIDLKPIEMEQVQSRKIIETYLPQDVLAKIETSAPTMSVQGEHRQVVVLFANFENNIGRKGDDPVRAISDMNEKIQRGFEMIRQHHGSIARIDPFRRGHKLLVLFGAPTKREDDEINALLCARKLNELSADGFRIRTGLAIGPLFCGDVGASRRREYTVMGDGINLAARLMAKADWGDIILGPTLRSGLPEEILTEPVSLALKGIGDNVTCHRFSGISETKSSMGDATSTIGQEAELSWLESAWQRTLGGIGQQVAITGPTGIGKTTLLHNLVAELSDTEPIELPGKNSRLFGRGWLSQKLMQSLLDRLPSMAGASLDEFIRKTIESRWLPLLTDILKADVTDNRWTKGLTPELRLAKTKELIDTLIRSLVTSPRLVAVDDFDQVDEFFRSMVSSLAESNSDCPLMVVVIARTLDALKLPDESLTPFKVLNVEGPSENQWWDYFADKFEGGVRERELFERVLNASKGNPHFIIQFLSQCATEKKLVENGVSNRWELPASGLEISVPDSLVNLHLSIFDDLPEIERTILKAASVAVGDFSAKLIILGLSELEQTTVENYLGRLVDSGLLQIQQQSAKYNFAHASMREAIYQCISGSQLRVVHRRYAELIEQKRSDEHISLLAYHFYRADMRKKGFSYSLLAARQSFKNYALAESAEYFGQCLNMLRATDDDTLDVTEALQFHKIYSEFLVLEGRYAEAYGIYRNWRKIGKREGITHDCLMAAIGTASLLWTQSRYPRSRMILDTVLNYTNTHGDELAQASALSILCNLERRAGEFSKAQELGRTAVDIARGLADMEMLSELQNRLGLAYWGGGRLSEAAATYKEAIESDKEDNRRLALAQNNLALIEWDRGHYVESEALLLGSLDILRNIGARRHEAYTLGNLGGLYHNFGKLMKSEEFYLQADLIFERLDDRHAHFYTVGNLGDVDLMRGDLTSAEHRFSLVAEFAKEVDDKELVSECEVRFGELAFFTGNVAVAESRYKNAIEIAEKIGSTEYLTRACVGLARLLIGERDDEEALRVIERISQLAADNNAILVENEAVFLKGEQHRIRNELEKAIPCYTKTLAYAQDQNLFELILKSAVRLYEINPGERTKAADTLTRLHQYFVDNNSLPAWDQLVRSAYFSYFADTLIDVVGCQQLSSFPTV